MKELFRRILLVFVLGLDLFFLFTLIFGSQGLVAYRDMKEKSSAVEAQVDAADQRILALSQEIRWLKSDPDYLREIIRSQTNALREDEILYLLPERQGTQGSTRGTQ